MIGMICWLELLKFYYSSHNCLNIAFANVFHKKFFFNVYFGTNYEHPDMHTDFRHCTLIVSLERSIGNKWRVTGGKKRIRHSPKQNRVWIIGKNNEELSLLGCLLSVCVCNGNDCETAISRSSNRGHKQLNITLSQISRRQRNKALTNVAICWDWTPQQSTANI
jgi:hypothetical protein